MTKTRAALPYLLEEPPTSTGKLLLSRAFEHWCALHHGYSSDEIVAAFDPAASARSDVRTHIGAAARLIGELAAAGELRTFARPVGGGSPERLPASDWELDDFRPGLALSAIDPKAPLALPSVKREPGQDGIERRCHRGFFDVEAQTRKPGMSFGRGDRHPCPTCWTRSAARW